MKLHVNLLIALCGAGLACCQVGGPLPRKNQPARIPPRVKPLQVAQAASARAKSPAPGVNLSKERGPLPSSVEVQVQPPPAAPMRLPFGLSLPSPGVFDCFFTRLDQLKAGQTRRARISIWGASHVAGEAFTGQLRRRLQATFGDAGPGFALLGRPWPSYRHSSVKFGESRDWRSERIWFTYRGKRRRPRDNFFGLAGISVHAGKPAFSWLEPRGTRAVSALDLYYLRQPRGGRLVLSADGKQIHHFLTMAHRKEAAFSRIELPAGTRRITFGVTSGEVRIFGVDLESGDPGVVCDAFGINGARSTSILKWNQPLLAAQLKRLQPDMLVLAYGSNSVGNTSLTPAKLARSFGEVVQQMRDKAPGADCLVIGPGDQARHKRQKGQGKSWVWPPNLDWIIDVQREEALRRGCAFWDWRAVMGGPRSILAWIQASPPLARKDHLHFTVKGYQALGDALFESLMALYRRRP